MEYLNKIVLQHIFILGLYLNLITSNGVQSGAMPPILLSNGEREWTVLDNAPIDYRVGQFTTSEKQKQVQFQIVVLDPYKGYLDVEEDTGIVYLKKSLLGLANHSIVFIGSVKSKKNTFPVQTEFYLKILPSSTREGIETTVKGVLTSPNHVKFTTTGVSSATARSTTELLHFNPDLTDNNYPYRTIQNQSHPDLVNENTKDDVLNKSSEESKEAKPFSWIYIAIPVIVLVITIPAIAILVWAVKYKFRKSKPSIKPNEFNDPVYHPTSLQSPFRRALPNRYIFNANRSGQENLEISRVDNARGENNNSKWEFPRQSLTIVGPLGEGCFGQVWQADAISLLNSGESATVAIKTLKENATEKEKEDLLSELEVMKLLDPHPNVVTLLGCCTEADPVFVIMEHMPYGKLQTYLRDSRVGHYYGNLHANSKTLSSRDLTSFAYQVAKGMQYLSSKGILHRDLAARNILVGENKLCKVSDFGLARDVIDSHIYERKSEGRLPIRWMAPESLFDNIFTTKTDIWSFGILMWEIVTLGSTPYPGMSASEVMRKVKEGCRLEKPDHCKRELYNIMYYCWDPEPEQRPEFGELCDLLENMLRTDTDYIDLNQFPDHSYYNVLLNSSTTDEKL